MDNKALFKLGYGLYVLSAREGERDNACIINTMMQITSDPLVAVVGVNKQDFTHGMIQRTGQFNVSTLTVEAPFEIFRRFGFQSGRDVDKFAGWDNWARAENGVVFLPRCANAYLSLKVLDAIDFGTHTLFRAAVEDGVVLSGAESVTYSFYQANIKPKPQPAAVKHGWRCRICGYVYEGDELPADFICPVCKHGASDFERF